MTEPDIELIKKKAYKAALLISIFFGIFLLFDAYFIVEPGYAAVHTRLGRIVDTKLDSGFHWKVPLLDSVTMLDTRIQKAVIKTEAFSHDLQLIELEVAINHRLLNPRGVFQNIGPAYVKTIIDPYTQESVKAIIAKFSAEELTQQRSHAKDLVKEDLCRSLEQVHIKLVDFNFIHADFHDDFIRAVENKQIAEQQAKRAKFDTLRVNEEVIQKKSRADADAYALQVQKEMATPQLALLKAIEKWNGELPRIIAGKAIPLIKE